jgi:hypothetical protein
MRAYIERVGLRSLAGMGTDGTLPEDKIGRRTNVAKVLRLQRIASQIEHHHNTYIKPLALSGLPADALVSTKTLSDYIEKLPLGEPMVQTLTMLLTELALPSVADSDAHAINLIINAMLSRFTGGVWPAHEPLIMNSVPHIGCMSNMLRMLYHIPGTIHVRQYNPVSARGKSSSKSTPVSSSSSSSSHSNKKKPSAGAMLRLLLYKALPRRCIARHYSAIMKDAINSNPDVHKRVIDIIVCSLLGNYPHLRASEHIRPGLHVRIRILNLFYPEMVLRVDSKGDEKCEQVRRAIIDGLFGVCWKVLMFAYREQLVYLINSDSTLKSYFSTLFCYSEMNRIVIMTMDLVRRFLNTNLRQIPGALMSDDKVLRDTDWLVALCGIVDTSHQLLLGVVYKRQPGSFMHTLASASVHIPTSMWWWQRRGGGGEGEVVRFVDGVYTPVDMRGLDEQKTFSRKKLEQRRDDIKRLAQKNKEATAHKQRAKLHERIKLASRSFTDNNNTKKRRRSVTIDDGGGGGGGGDATPSASGSRVRLLPQRPAAGEMTEEALMRLIRDDADPIDSDNDDEEDEEDGGDDNEMKIDSILAGLKPGGKAPSRISALLRTPRPPVVTAWWTDGGCAGDDLLPAPGTTVITSTNVLLSHTVALAGILKRIPPHLTCDVAIEQLWDLLPCFGCPRSGVQKFMKLSDDIAGGVATREAIKDTMWSLSISFPYTYALLMTTVHLWNNHSTYQQFELPGYMTRNQIGSANAEYAGLTEATESKTTTTTILLQCKIELSYCDVCATVQSLFQEHHSKYKQQYRYGYRDSASDLTTGGRSEIYCPKSDSCVHLTCGQRPLQTSWLLGYAMMIQSRVYHLCPQPRCTTIMIFNSSLCEFNEHGIACVNCSAKIVNERERKMELEACPIFDIGSHHELDSTKYSCYRCRKQIQSQEGLLMYGYQTFLCVRHGTRYLNQFVTKRLKEMGITPFPRGATADSTKKLEEWEIQTRLFIVAFKEYEGELFAETNKNRSRKSKVLQKRTTASRKR